MSKKNLLKLFLLVFVLLNSFVIVAYAGADERVDLDCFRQQLLDPTVVCDPKAKIINAKELPISECTKNGIPNCTDQATQLCVSYQLVVVVVPIQYYACPTVIDETKCTPACDASTKQVCRVSNVKDALAGATPVYQCQQNTRSAAVVIPRLTRNVFTIVLAFLGFFAMFQIFTSIWTGSTATDENTVEDSQKNARNTMFGLGFVLASLVIVQLVASLAGVQGDIFDFSLWIP